MHEPGRISFAPRRSPHRCGQCEQVSASNYCEQCKEMFCWTCAAAIHQKGKMADHSWIDVSFDAEGLASPQHSPRQTHSSGNRERFTSPECFFHTPLWRPSAIPAVSLSKSQSSKACFQDFIGKPTCSRFSSDSMEAESRANVCSLHPGISAEFCCITCRGKFECAFCAASCSRDGHEMFSFFEAMEELPERVNELEAILTTRTSELIWIIENCKSLIRHFADVVARFRYKVTSSFQIIRAAVEADETSLGMEVNCCSREVAHIFTNRNVFSEKIASLMQEYENSIAENPVVRLNLLSKLRHTLSTQFQYPGDVQLWPSMAGVRHQVKHGFAARRARLDLLGKDINPESKGEELSLITKKPNDVGIQYAGRDVEQVSNAEKRDIVRSSGAAPRDVRQIKPLRLSNRVAAKPGILVTGFEDLDTQSPAALIARAERGRMHARAKSFERSYLATAQPQSEKLHFSGLSTAQPQSEKSHFSDILTEESDILAYMGHVVEPQDANEPPSQPRPPESSETRPADSNNTVDGDASLSEVANNTVVTTAKAIWRAASKPDLDDTSKGYGDKDGRSSRSSSVPATPPPEQVEEQERASFVRPGPLRRNRTGRIVEEGELRKMMKLADEIHWEVGDKVKVLSQITYEKKQPLEKDMEGEIRKIDKEGDLLIEFQKLGCRAWVLKPDLSKLSQVS